MWTGTKNHDSVIHPLDDLSETKPEAQIVLVKKLLSYKSVSSKSGGVTKPEKLRHLQ